MSTSVRLKPFSHRSLAPCYIQREDVSYVRIANGGESLVGHPLDTELTLLHPLHIMRLVRSLLYPTYTYAITL